MIWSRLWADRECEQQQQRAGQPQIAPTQIQIDSTTHEVTKSSQKMPKKPPKSHKVSRQRTKKVHSKKAHFCCWKSYSGQGRTEIAPTQQMEIDLTSHEVTSSALKATQQLWSKQIRRWMGAFSGLWQNLIYEKLLLFTGWSKATVTLGIFIWGLSKPGFGN